MPSNPYYPGFVNNRGQVVFFKTDKLTEHFFRVFKLGCSFCGFAYDAVENEVPECRCPACQIQTAMEWIRQLDFTGEANS